MNVTYTGRHTELSAAQLEKLQAEFNKVARLLDSPRGQSSAHVRLSHERHLHSVEITVGYHGHDLIGEASGADLSATIHAAVAKLEQQAIRTKDKWRDSRREPDGITGIGEIKESSN